MYPAADIEDLDAQIQIVEAEVANLNLLSRSRDTRLKAFAAQRQLEVEKELKSLKAARHSREQLDLALVAETPGKNGKEPGV